MNNYRNLEDILNRTSSQSQQGTDDSYRTPRSFQAFLMTFSNNIAIRYPDVTNFDLRTLDYEEIKRIADFSAAVSVVALETWDQYFHQPEQSKRDRVVGQRSTRAA